MRAAAGPADHPRPVDAEVVEHRLPVLGVIGNGPAASPARRAVAGARPGDVAQAAVRHEPDVVVERQPGTGGAVVEDEWVTVGRAGLPDVERAAVGEGDAGALRGINHAVHDARSRPADSDADSKTPRGTSVSMRPPPRLMQAPVAELDASTERDR